MTLGLLVVIVWALNLRFCDLKVPCLFIGVFPKIGGIPKWMVKVMENPVKMDDLGGKPTIFGIVETSIEKFRLFFTKGNHPLQVLKKFFLCIELLGFDHFFKMPGNVWEIPQNMFGFLIKSRLLLRGLGGVHIIWGPTRWGVSTSYNWGSNPYK